METTQQTQQTTLRTTIHAYRFDVSTTDGKRDYAALCAKLTGLGLKCMESWGDNSHYIPSLDGVEVDLETAHLFENQWNTAPVGESKLGYRLFDWAQDYFENRSIKQGHWLEQTKAMTKIRRNVSKCGYCGKQENTGKFVFCPHCIDSQYLKEDDLKLTRMRPIAESGPGGKFAELTDEEKAVLVPAYRQAQIHGKTEKGIARIAKQRQDVEKDRASKIRTAESEYKAKVWILDNCPNMLDNYIYYSHNDTHCFGWRNYISPAMQPDVEKVLVGFPFAYEFAKDRKY